MTRLGHLFLSTDHMEYQGTRTLTSQRSFEPYEKEEGRDYHERKTSMTESDQ